METIGILGGSFNPPTIGHIKLAEFALTHTDLDQVWIMPCNNHRFKQKLQSAKHRLKMCAIACAKSKSNIKTINFEIKNKLSGSTYETNRLLQRKYPDIIFKFIIGMDNAKGINSWKNAEHLKANVPFIVISRQGITGDDKPQWYNVCPHTFINAGSEVPETSSTEARALIMNYKEEAGNHGLDRLLYKEVQEYIYANNLYIGEIDESRIIS